MNKGVKDLKLIAVTGVAGSGKTTVGRLVAESLSWRFFDADDCHPNDNVDKMRQGKALTDEDRQKWLMCVCDEIRGFYERGEQAVVAFPGLKRVHRRAACLNQPGVCNVFLQADYKTILARMAHRKSHFFPPELLKDQFELLEPDEDALQLDAKLSDWELVERILTLTPSRS